MSTKSTPKPAAKTSTYKGKNKSRRDYADKSKEGVKPLYECSEKELIEEGSRPPFKRNISFQKTAKERAQLNRVHTGRKGPYESIPLSRPQGLPCLLVAHIKNRTGKKDFKTTYSFIVYSNQVNSVLNTFFYLNDEGSSKREFVTKCYYNGKPYKVNQLAM